MRDFINAKMNNQKITDETSLGALQDGELGEIVNKLPEETKNKLGL